MSSALLLFSLTATPRNCNLVLPRCRRRALVCVATIFLCGSIVMAAPQTKEQSGQSTDAVDGKPILYCATGDAHSKDLYYGEGGKDATPPQLFTFDKEDLSGTNPKFDLRDEHGDKWRAKLGAEARPETVATRLLWAAGYFSNEEYFLPKIRVKNMPPVSNKRRKLVRGLIDSDGTMYNVELKRYPKGEKKIGTWKWRENPFRGTREFNGLRVMMALLNNWDVKDVNTGIYQEDAACGSSADPLVYMVSDMGATFGTSGEAKHDTVGKGNLRSYRRSKFIRKVTPTYVDFDSPARMTLFGLIDPSDFLYRWRLRWIGKRVPRADAKWMGQILSRLSKDQIRDAFRAAGYSPAQVDGFTDIVSQRIAALNQL